MIGDLLKSMRKNMGFTYIASANIITSALGAGFWLFFASIIPVENYGKINYLISSATIAFGIGILGLDTTIMTYLPKKSINLVYQANSLVLIAAIPISFVAGLLVGNYVVTTLVLGIAIYYMSTIELLANRNHKEFALVAIGGRTAQIVISILLYSSFGMNGFLLGYSLAYLFFGYRFVFSLRHFTIRFRDVAALKSFSLQSYGFNTSKTLMFHLDKILIESFFGSYILGSYQLSFQYFMLISLIPTSLFQYLLPNEAAGISSNKIKVIGISLAVASAAIGVFLTPYVLPIFFPNYLQSINSIQIISLSAIPLTFITLITTKMLADNKSLQVLIGGIIYIISQTTLLVILGKAFGITGLASSVVLALTFELSFLVIVNYLKLKVSSNI